MYIYTYICTYMYCVSSLWTGEIGLEIITTAKITTNFHGSPCEFQTNLHGSPQNFKEIFTE